MQEAAIPPLLAGRDLLAEAPTGTGKTAAFALPILQRLAFDGLGRAEAGTALSLVLVPTRELAMQVAEAVHRYGRVLGARVLPVYGGQLIGQQLRGLRRGLDVVVATPGRAVDHLTRGSLRLDAVEVVILDEADEMLDMGFAEELDTILSATPAGRQTALFSATISPTIARVASSIFGSLFAFLCVPTDRPRRPRRRSARWSTSCAAPTSLRHWEGSSTWRTRPRRSCLPGRAARSTTWQRRSAGVGTTRPPFTEACRRSSATA